MGLLMTGHTALAQVRYTDRATELAGLFAQTCVDYAGDAAGLRAWVAAQGLRPLPREAQHVFLLGPLGPGIAYNASGGAGQFFVVSYDDGACTAIGAAINAAALLPALRNELGAPNLSLELAFDRVDPTNAHRRLRGFTLSEGEAVAAILMDTNSADGLAFLHLMDPKVLSETPRRWIIAAPPGFP